MMKGWIINIKPITSLTIKMIKNAILTESIY